MIYKLEFEILPVSKERPRFSKVNGIVRVRTSTKTRSFERTIAALARKQLTACKPFEKLIVANVDFHFKRPKHTKLSTPKKDIDNLMKSLFDALNEVAYLDDTQIVEVHARKSWASEDKIFLELIEL